MLITDSLASGLRRDFWRYLDEAGMRLRKRVNATFPTLATTPAATTKAINRGFKLLDTAIAGSPLAFYSGIAGRKQHRQWWLLYPQVDRSRALNDWQEACLRLDVYHIKLTPFDVNETWYTALIGEHCVGRMFQRIQWEATPSATDILPELKELAGWLPWFIVIDKASTDKHKGHVYCAFLPTANGVFLGCHHPDDHGIIDIRTYVGKHQLRPRQLALWTAIRAIRLATPAFDAGLGATVTGIDRRTEWEPCLLAMHKLLALHEEYQDVLLDELLEEHPSLVRPASKNTYMPNRDISGLEGYVIDDDQPLLPTA